MPIGPPTIDPNSHTLAQHTYPNVGDYNYVFTARNECGNTIQKTGTITVSNTVERPFYYVSNSTNYSEGDDGDVEFWGNPASTSYSTLNIPVTWDNIDIAINDTIYLFFWYGGINLENGGGDGPGSPDGMVTHVATSNSGTATITAYVPVDATSDIVGTMVAWYCSGNLDEMEEPEVYDVARDTAYMERNVKIKADSVVNLANDPAGFALYLPYWEGICSADIIDGHWEADLGDGKLARLDIGYDEQNQSNYYRLYIDNNDSNGNTPTVSEGNYYDLAGTIEFYEMYGECGSATGVYDYNIANGLLTFNGPQDGCTNRANLLTSQPFMRVKGDKMDIMPGCPGDEVKFTALGGQNYEWHFGDNTTSTGAAPVAFHKYMNVGQYNAFVIITNHCNQVDTVYTKVFIDNNMLHPVNFSFDPWEPMAMADTVSFKYYDFDEVINESLIWDFGDGSTSNLRNPKHMYMFGGNYEVKLTVSNGCGNNTGYSHIFVRGPGNPCNLKANFIFNTDTGLTVSFLDQSEFSFAPHLWKWEFGDGKFGIMRNPVHTYQNPGMYNVCLKVTDTLAGCTNSMCYQVQVGEVDCYADFNFTIDQANLKAVFIDKSSDAVEWFW
ncbi:MAG: PKD domain-containing protein, partial [Bacteroidales bacterium]|nr:PKD domain-containing protein [Bacteroidales bacterium]